MQRQLGPAAQGPAATFALEVAFVGERSVHHKVADLTWILYELYQVCAREARFLGS